MPKLATELKDAAVKALKHDGKPGHTVHAVGGVKGLLLQITATGGRSWVMRVRVKGAAPVPEDLPPDAPSTEEVKKLIEATRTNRRRALSALDLLRKNELSDKEASRIAKEIGKATTSTGRDLKALKGQRKPSAQGQRKHYGLGSFPEVSLAEARRRAADVRDAIRTGADPGEAWRIGAAARDMMAKGYAQGEAWTLARNQRQAIKDGATAADRMTFEKAAGEFLKTKLSEFKSETHRKQWGSTLTTYAMPVIGKMDVAAITVHDIERVLKPIWDTKTETASRLRGRIESVLAWATVKKHRSGDNPARWKGNLDAIMPKPSKVASKDNQPALQLSDAAAWFAALQKRGGMGARAVEFLTLCASRSGEVRGAGWSEFHDLDGDNPMWIIPASRMKMGKEHRVPLPPAAVALLDALPRNADAKEGQDFVFWAPRGGMLSNATLSKVMRDMQEAAVKKGGKGWLDRASGRPAVPHGLRSTFRDWAAEHTEYPRDVAEIALAHKVGSEVERAYRRSDMVEKRRALMADWAAFLNG